GPSAERMCRARSRRFHHRAHGEHGGERELQTIRRWRARLETRAGKLRWPRARGVALACRNAIGVIRLPSAALSGLRPFKWGASTQGSAKRSTLGNVMPLAAASWA